MTKGSFLVWLNKCLGWCQDKHKWNILDYRTPTDRQVYLQRKAIKGMVQ